MKLLPYLAKNDIMFLRKPFGFWEQNRLRLADDRYLYIHFSIFQVQHMMPSNYSTSLSSANGNGHNQHYSGLQSANMVSSMQTSSSKQSYTSYKVQSNSYTSRHLDSHQQEQDQDRPGSRLKANIDELDTLLSDLNNAQNTNSRHQETSSEDYGDQGGIMQGQVNKTITSMNEYTMSSGGKQYNYE